MAGRSTIETHPDRKLIENAIASGMKATVISRLYNVSESAISRRKSKRMAEGADATPAGGGDPTDVMRRLIDVADSARRARQVADATGNPAAKAKAQTVELQVLNTLVDRLGITDVTPVYFSEMARELYGVFVRLVADRPETRADVLAMMRSVPTLEELAGELAETTPRTTP